MKYRNPFAFLSSCMIPIAMMFGSHQSMVAQSMDTYTFNSGGGQVSMLSDRIIIWSLGETFVGSYQNVQPTYIFGFQAMIDEFLATSHQLERVISNVLIYPKPATKELHVEWEQPLERKISLLITSVNGKILYRKPLENALSGPQVATINLQPLNPGNYLLLLQGTDGEWLSVEKFIKM